MKSETLIYGIELLVILDENENLSFRDLEKISKIKGEELRELLKYLKQKDFIIWKFPISIISLGSDGGFVGNDKRDDDKIKLAPKGMEVVLDKRDYFIGGEKVIEEKVKIKVIFDSNIYDLIADGFLDINSLLGKKEEFEFYITHIQIDEINKCSDEEKRARLFLFKSKLSPIVIPTESVICGISRYGEAKYGGGQIIKEIIKGNLKHTKDALVGETAIKNNFLLVTEDNQLKNKVNSFNGRAVSLEEFKESLK